MQTWDRFVQNELERGVKRAVGIDRPCVGCYGDLEAEHRALGSGPALVDRSYRALLEVTGTDRAGWLHNLTTNEVKNLAPGEGNYAFALNLQGRIQFDLIVSVREESVWVDVDVRFVERVRKHFEKYTITEDVAVADRSGDFVRFGLLGEAAKAVLAERGAPHAAALPWFAMTEITWDDVTIPLLRHDFCGTFAVELFVPAEKAVETWQRLCDASGEPRALPVGDDAVQLRRIEAGIPWPLCEITDEYLPGETGLSECAVSITKGCYLGQEIVERMRSRGVVARRLVGLLLEGDQIPTIPAALESDDGSAVGELTSACGSVALSAVIGLGYVKAASASPGTQLRVASGDQETCATVVGLPFADAETG